MLAFLVLLAAQDLPVTIDRDALRECLGDKTSDRCAFDFDYLATLPAVMVAGHSHPSRQNGKLGLFLEIQKEPLILPERIQAIAASCAKSLPDLFALADEVIGRTPPDVTLRSVGPAPGFPEKVASAIGRIRAAVATKDPATIARVVLEAKPDLAHSGSYKDAELEIYFDGDQTHRFEKPVSRIQVVIDLQGNDRYEGAVAAANGGVAMVFDFAGHDLYESKGEFAQAAAIGGTALLYDGAGNDRYVLGGCGQAFAREGVAALVDLSGNDVYEITRDGQGYGQWSGFAILLDAEGDDSYLGRDPLYGHAVTDPAPQDAKHNANMVQGAGQGYNAKPHKAGGVGILLDRRGDDTYRSGCWSQGVGYFMGIGALLDLEGDDTYQSWVYVMGSGAHGGFGLLVDAKGDDGYTVGGWNGPAMAVDFGAGIFLDAAGHDRYASGNNGFGSSIGLGIAIFQDAGGDDVYDAKNGKLGFGRFYEREDYNDDKQITPPEKRHWGMFLDLGGMDRYPKGIRNGGRWEGAEVSGGLDRASPRNVLIEKLVLPDWEDRVPAEVFAEMKKGAASPADLKALAEFGFAHGLVNEASEALFKAGGSLPGAEYMPALRLWVPQSDREWAERLLKFRASLAVEELPDVKPMDGPKWVKRQSRELIAEAIAERKSAALDRVMKWVTSLKPLLDRRAALDQARAKDATKLRALWAARKQGALRADPEVRRAAGILDKLDPKWRTGVPLACNLEEESLTLESLSLTETERAQLVHCRDVGKANESAKEPARSLARELNALRAMHGRGAVGIEAALCEAAEAGLRDPQKPLAERIKGFDGEVKEASVKGRDVVTAVDAAGEIVLAPHWTSVGVALSANGQWRLVLGRKK